MKPLTVQFKTLLSTYSFSIVSISSFAITFFQNFIFAAFLSKESFGRVFLIVTLFSAFSYLFVAGLDTSIFKFFFDKNFQDKNRLIKGFMLTWQCAIVVIAAILLIIGYILINYFHYNFLEFSTGYIPLVTSGVFFSFFLISQQYFIAAKKIWPYAFTCVGVKLFILVCNLVAIIIYGPDINALVYSYLISTGLVFILAIYLFGLFKVPIGDKQMIWEILSFSWPLMINTVINISFTNVYRIIISALIPFASLATFGIISQVSSAYYIGLTSLLLPYNSGAYQYLLDQHDKKAEIPYYRKMSFNFGVMGFLAMSVVSFFFLAYFRQGLYLEGFRFLPLLLASQFFFLMYSHEYIVLSYFKKTTQITISTFSGIVVIFLSFYFLITFFGLWGACAVPLIGYMVQYSVAVHYRRKIKMLL